MRVLRLGDPLPNRTEGNPMFKGDVHMSVLFDQPESELFRVFEVTFRPGARTVWHTHSSDQLLVVTNGHGIVATDDGEQRIRTGDCVLVTAGERHWHGATDTAEMTHVAMLTPGTNQLEDD